MNSISIKNASEVDSLCLSDPYVSNTDELNKVLFCEIKNGSDQQLYIQTPKMMFSNPLEDSVELMFKSSEQESIDMFYDLISNVEKKLCKIISEYSHSWFSQQLTSDEIKSNLFKNSVSLPERLKDPLAMKIKIQKDDEGRTDFEIYDRSQKKLDYEYMKSRNYECTFLITAKELIISRSQARIEWELVQVLVHKKKKNIKGFGIRKETPKETSNEISNEKETPKEKEISNEKSETPKEKETPKETHKETHKENAEKEIKVNLIV